jgi:hypothetical protein
VALIEFDFLPVEALGEFSRAHWFGLTDAHFCLRVGAQSLFERAESARAENDSDPDTADRRIGYQLARLHADLLELLPNVLAALPPARAADVRTLDDQLAWLGAMKRRHEALPDDDERADAYSTAIGWLQEARRLDTGYLHAMPAIWLLRIDDELHLRWHGGATGPARHWSATSGTHVLPVDRFVAGITDFHDRLVDGTIDRIDALARAGEIDRAAFEQDHAEAAALLERALAAEPDREDRDEVEEAIALLHH